MKSIIMSKRFIKNNHNHNNLINKNNHHISSNTNHYLITNIHPNRQVSFMQE
jgi:hypothetical protein